ncbi:MAG: DNA/RNA nuclease SfsA [Cyanobacteria bacterium J083]|nr:MAG: DNA/RNA nuclease SfsA [Cyanobacteria bacterium J083]
MNNNFIYTYPPLLPGRLLKRYKRFFAEIELTRGEIITAHCPNTGPMIGVSTPGSLVQVSKSDNPKRKLAYTWEMIQVNESKPTWVGVNTNLPNKVVKLGLQQGIFAELASKYNTIRSEVPYGEEKKSRIDFLLTSEQTEKPDIYLEVKNVTLAQGVIALFPDTVSIRGQKHLQELLNLPANARGVMLYFINRADCLSFAPADEYDSTYAKLLRQAAQAGLEILPYRFAVEPAGIRYLGLAELLL